MSHLRFGYAISYLVGSISAIISYPMESLWQHLLVSGISIIILAITMIVCEVCNNQKENK